MSNSDKRRVRNAEIADSGEAMPYEHNPADTRGSQEGMASSKQACLRLELHVEKVCAYWWTVGTYWLQYEIVVGAMYTIAICWHKIEEQRYKSECHAQKIKYPGPLKVDVKSHIANGIVQSCIVTVCVLLVMSPASHQIVKVGSNTPAPALDFDMPLGARANMQPAIKKP